MASRRAPNAAAWKRLGKAVKQSREDDKDWTQQELADRADLSLSTVQSVEGGRRPKRWDDETPKSYRACARALGWPDDWAMRVLHEEGLGAPPIIHRNPTQTAPSENSDLVTTLRLTVAQIGARLMDSKQHELEDLYRLQSEMHRIQSQIDAAIAERLSEEATRRGRRAEDQSP